MPTRYLKQGICDSDSIDSISPESERFYYRLLVNVDDFGRLDARLPILKSKCFPLKDTLDLNLVEKWLEELAINSLVNVYKCKSNPYLQFNKWDNKPRASESKFPEQNSRCIQMYTDVKQLHTDVPLTVTVTETVNRNSELENLFDDFYSQYPKRVGKEAAKKAWGKIKTKDVELIMQAIATQKERNPQWVNGDKQYIKAPSVWLNGKHWQDEFDSKESSKLNYSEEETSSGLDFYRSSPC